MDDFQTPTPVATDEPYGDFAQTYWRRAGYTKTSLSPLTPDQVDSEQLHLLVDNLPNPCWMANADGYIVWYNRRWHQYCGTTPVDMEGWGWTSVHDPRTLPAVIERWTLSITSGRPFEMTFPLKGADGVFRPFLTRVVPLIDGEGRLARWFGSNLEVTSHAGLEPA